MLSEWEHASCLFVARLYCHCQCTMDMLCVLDLRPAAVSCIIVQKLNRCSIYGLVGAYSEYKFLVLRIMLCDPHWLCTYNHLQKNTFSVSSTQVCSSQCLLQKFINLCRLWRSLVGMSFFQVCWLQTFFSQLLPWFIVEKLTISSLPYVQALISALHWPVLYILGCGAFEI